MFITSFKLYKWYQNAQRTTYWININNREPKQKSFDVFFVRQKLVTIVTLELRNYEDLGINSEISAVIVNKLICLPEKNYLEDMYLQVFSEQLF